METRLSLTLSTPILKPFHHHHHNTHLPKSSLSLSTSQFQYLCHYNRNHSLTITCQLKATKQSVESEKGSLSKKISVAEGAPPLSEDGDGGVPASRGGDSGAGKLKLVKKLWRKVLSVLSNLPLAIGEMASVAALMAVGTIIEQGEAPGFYFQKYSEDNPALGFFTWRWIFALGFDHMFSCPLFLSLLGLLAASLMACTYTTQIPLVKVARRWSFSQSAESISKQEFAETLPRASVRDLGVILMGHGYEVFLKGPSLYAFKGLAGRFAPIGVHLAMLLIMVGGTLSAAGSFKGSVTVPQGLNFIVGDVLGPSGFLSFPTEAFNTEVHVNRFFMDYYDSGEVRQFYSDLSLLDLEGKEVMRKTISVNDPLRYGGFTIYQTDWSLSALQILRDDEGPFNLAMAPLKINGDKKLYGTFLPVGSPDSPNVKGISMLARDLQSIVLYDLEGKFAGIRRPNSKLPIDIDGNKIVIVDAIGSTGLDLKTDPGVPVVYAGFGFLMLTTCISFLSHSQVITKESLLAAQWEDLRRVMDLLSLREHHARTLLIYYRWNMERLFAVLVEKGEACLFAEAGLTVVGNHDLDSQPPPTIVCNICMEDVPCTVVTKMDCGHSFCNDCWTGHFVVKINEGQSKRMRCMAHKCNAICDEAIVRKLVSKMDPDLAEKFDRILLESYIEDNKMVKWCPSTPHCGNAIRVEEDEFCEVECSCGLQFCFSCLAEAHSPCSCSMWELWTKKCRDETANANWITVHTKPCPKCHKAVEKNGGCNLVRCICGPIFCWVCGVAIGPDGHSCGRYEKDREKKTKLAKCYLYRYMHYHSRYKAHIDSFKHESKLEGTLEEKVVNLEKKDSPIRDVSWVRNGLDRLLRSRRVISYSYPFAFIMFGDDLFKDEITKKEREIKQHLFEDQQQQLEANVEKLSHFMYEPFDQFAEDKVMETRMQVINLSVITDNLCRKMYECIENDLLGSLQFGIHNIAPYHSKGIEKATELSVCWNHNVTNKQKHQSSN